MDFRTVDDNNDIERASNHMDLDKIRNQSGFQTAGIVTSVEMIKNQFMLLTLSDLKETHLPVIVYAPAMDHFKSVLNHLVVLSPTLLKSTENGQFPALVVSDPGSCRILGKSLDACICKAPSCTVPFDKRRGEYCSLHTLQAYKKSRLKRQEFASGDALFTLGDPTLVKQSSKPSTILLPDGSTLTTTGHATIYKSPLKPTSKRVRTEAEEKQ